MTDDADIEREEIESLLPWYETGKLGNADALKVETYLSRHPHMLAQLARVRAEREQTVLANEALGSPGIGGLERLMTSLPSARPSLPRRVSTRAWFSGLTNIFSMPTRAGVRWVMLAAVSFILAEAIVIAALFLRDGGATYQEAAGRSPGAGVSVLVGFSENARASAITQLLTEFDASIVDGPKPGGLYKIKLRTLQRSQQARDAILGRLAERRDVVRVVLPSGD